MPKQREITGVFKGEHRVFVNDEGTDFETRVIIGNLETEDGKITIKGEVAEGELRVDLTYRFYGYTKHHPKFGEQFNFDGFLLETPATREAVVAYLRQCKGIGPGTAHLLFDEFGEKAIEKLIYFDAALAWAIEHDYLAQKSDSMGSTWLAEFSKASAEDRVARSLIEAREELDDHNGLTLWPSVHDIEGLTDHQRSELVNATNGTISILAGSPGTGKTYCSAALIKAIIKQFGQDKVAVAAPTGKAAVRVTEAMQRNEIDMKAVTIHSLLKVESSGGDGGFAFAFGRDFPLPQQFVIIDESSMIDTSLMASLLAARGKGTHYLFVGDTNQLAPVGHGAPLRDMIVAGVPCGTLTEIQRNSGRIVKACAEIRDHHRFTASPKIDVDGGENLFIVETETPEDQIETLQSIMQQFVSAVEQKHDPIWDIQILVAVNKRSPLGRKPLNSKLQDLLNPHGQRAAGSPFRVSDKIINTKNGWLPQPPGAPANNPEANKDGKLYVANGEQAEVLQVESNKTVTRLANPDRVVLIPRGTQDDAEREPRCNFQH